MTLVVLAVVVATLLALAFRGSIAQFSRPRTHRIGLLVFAALAEVTALIAQHPSVYGGWLAAGAIALVVYARLNPGRPGLYLAAGGMALNAVAVFVNWGMPVSLDAADRAGVPDSRIDLPDDPLRLELDDETLLPWLGEAIPLALPLRPAVASPGDVLTAAGAAVVIFTGLTGRGRPQPTVKPPKGKRARGKNRSAEAASTVGTTVGGPAPDGDMVAVGAMAVESVGAAAAGGGVPAGVGDAGNAGAGSAGSATAIVRGRSVAPEVRSDGGVESSPTAERPSALSTDPDGSAVARFGGIHEAGGATVVSAAELAAERTQVLDSSATLPSGTEAGVTVPLSGEDGAAPAAGQARIEDGEVGADADADEPDGEDDGTLTEDAPGDPAAMAAAAARKAEKAEKAEKREKKLAKKQARREAEAAAAAAATAAAAAAEPVDKGEPPAAWRI